MVLNCPPRPSGDVNGGPCYRCVFPKPPPAETVVSCSDGGILGPVVGVMGVLQALEAIKMIASGRTESPGSVDAPLSNGAAANASDPPSLLLFSAYSSPQFRSVRLRGRKSGCATCSSQATITPQALTSGSMDYVQFCGLTGLDKLPEPGERISASIFGKCRNAIPPTVPEYDPIIIDVREEVQFELCNIDGSHNVPFSKLSAVSAAGPGSKELYEELRSLLGDDPRRPVGVICRQGNDSQVAVRLLNRLGLKDDGGRWIGDIIGGLVAWKQDVDPEFPEY